MRTKDTALIKAVGAVVREYVTLAIGDVAARVNALEAQPAPVNGKDGAPGPVGTTGADGPAGPLGERGPEGPAGAVGLDGNDGKDGKDGAVGPLGERGPAGLDGAPGRDGRDGLPGVPGAPGEKGLDGVSGRDGTHGRDGTLKDQIKLVRRSERVMELCFKDDTPIEGGLIKLNHPVFKDTFVKEADYEEGDLVQWDGAGWIALKDRPPGVPGQGKLEVTGWKLWIKKGRDGRDGKDGPSGPPGPTGQNWEQMMDATRAR